MKSQNRDFELEAIVGNMLISQYQSHILKSRIADRLDEWWALTQDRDRNSSSFTFNRERKKFTISLRTNEFMLGNKDRRRYKRK
jgi:hypothetical protein